MKKNVLKSIALFFMASVVSTTAWGVTRNATLTGADLAIQPEVSYYAFNLGTSMYLSTDYQHVARASVVKNPFGQIQFITSSEDGFYYIKQVAGDQKVINRYIFEHNANEIWTDRGEATNDAEGRIVFWSASSEGNGVYKIQNQKTAATFWGPESKEARRTYTNIASESENAKWAFIQAEAGTIDYFHAKEALLFEKINEVEAIDGFSADLINAATAVYTNESATLDQIRAALASLNTAQYDLASATTVAPVACTELIVNPEVFQYAYYGDAKRHQPFGWEYCTNSGSNGQYAQEEGEGGRNTVLEAFAANENEVAALNFDYYQIIQGVPNGYYILSAICKNQQVADPNGAAGLYAESGLNSVFKGVITTGDAPYSTDFIKVENNTLKIGVRNKEAMTARWFTADNFTLDYYGTESPVAVFVDETQLIFTETNIEKTFNVSGLNLSADVTITVVPEIAGLEVDPATVPFAGVNDAPVEITVTFDPAATGATSAYGSITLASTGAITKTIDVITSVEENYTPRVSSGNYISDPTITDASKFKGWGSKSVVSIKDEPDVAYSGAFCGKVSDNERGSFETDLISTLEPNTDYVMSAMIKTIGGSFNFAVTASTANTGADVYEQIDTEGEWELVELNFKTGANPTGTIAYFNNWDGNGASGTIGYIDNWELYKKTDIGADVVSPDMIESLTLTNVAGGIKLQAAKGVAVNVFTVNGQIVEQLNINAGETVIALPAGVYVINGKKAVVF